MTYVELDARWIQRSDFSQARRGYDPDEVDQHLREIADAVEDLKAAREEAPAPGPASVAGVAAEQVRAIVQAAEGSASQIESDARAKADSALSEARAEAAQERGSAASDAARVRSEAQAEAANHVEKVQAAMGGISTHAEGVDSQLGGLVEELKNAIAGLAEKVRTSSGELEGELHALKRGLGDVRGDDAPAEEVATADDDGYEDDVEPAHDTIVPETVEYSVVDATDEDDEEIEAEVGGELEEDLSTDGAEDEDDEAVEAGSSSDAGGSGSAATTPRVPG